MVRMLEGLRKVWTDQGGISSVEYAMMLALVGAGISVATGLLGDSVADRISGSSDVFDPGSGGGSDVADAGDSPDEPAGVPGGGSGGGGDGGCHNQGGGDGIGQGKGKGGDNTC